MMDEVGCVVGRLCGLGDVVVNIIAVSSMDLPGGVSVTNMRKPHDGLQ